MEEKKEKQVTIEIWTKTREAIPLSPKEPLMQPLVIEATNTPNKGVATFQKGKIEVEIVNYLNIHEAELLKAHPKVEKAIPFLGELGKGWFEKGSVTVRVPEDTSFEEAVRIATDVIAGALNATVLEKKQ